MNPIQGNQAVMNRRRKVRKTVTIYKMRLDQSAEDSLAYIMDALSGQSDRDVCTVAMSCRRALKFYASVLEQYKHDTTFMAREMAGVRMNTFLPQIKSPKTSELPAPQFSQAIVA